MIGRVGKGLYNFLQDIGSGTVSTVYVAMNLTTNKAAPLPEPQVPPPRLWLSGWPTGKIQTATANRPGIIRPGPIPAWGGC
jgi:hypothetical protein